MQTQTEDKFRTTIYLTAENKEGLDDLPRGEKTRLINEAITSLLAKMKRERLKQELLHELNHGQTVPAEGISTQAVLRRIRAQETTRLIQTASD